MLPSWTFISSQVTASLCDLLPEHALCVLKAAHCVACFVHIFTERRTVRLHSLTKPHFHGGFVWCGGAADIKKLPEDKLNKLGLLLFIQYLLNHRILWDRLSEALEVPGFLEVRFLLF